VIQAGIHIPADGILISGEDVHTTEAEITGENDNIKKCPPEECAAIEEKLRPLTNMDEVYSEEDVKVDHKHDIPSPALLAGT
jgi:magnesium-transporting ATPase (P-type)